MTFVMAQASTAEPIQVTVNTDPGLTEWINVALTAVLVAITAVYVVLTGHMASEAKKQREAAEKARLREKSDQAA